VESSVVGRAVRQAKRIALLVYLATARPGAFHRRDSLLALFWPELDDERARASLRKTIFHLRRSLGENLVLNRGDDEVGLDFSALAVDAVQVVTAARTRDAQSVVDSYTGIFLDGFFIGDAPGFDDWVDRHRRHLHGLAFDAAWSLAQSAEGRGDSFGAAHFARRAADLTPDDEGALRRLMEMLDRLGDRAGALAAYEDFARRLHRDYESAPSVETRALLETIRSVNSPAEEIAALPVAAPIPKTGKRRAFSRRRLALLGVFAVSITAMMSGVTTVTRIGPNASARVIAVMPFAFRGKADFSYLGDGMVNLLSTNLDHIGEFRAADAALVLGASGKSHDQPLSPNEASVRALQLGAGFFVLGDVVEAGGRLRVSASLYDARRPGRALARATAENEVTRLFEVIDAITSQLVAGERRSPAERFTRLALLTTQSVPALKSYLIGERQFREGRYNEAMESFQNAVAADTTFALGYYRLALAHMWGSSDADREAAQRAVTFGSRLAGPDRALLQALLPFFRGDVEEAERQYRAILVRRPDESEVWYPLGEVLFHHNSSRGKSAADAKHAFERALALGPKDGPLTHLLEIAAIQRDWVAYDSLWTGMQRGAHFHYVGEIVVAFRSNDPRERDRVVNALRDTSDARLATAARHALYLLEEPEYSEVLLRLMTENSRPANVRNWGYVHLAHLAVGGGRPAVAAVELARAARMDAERTVMHEAWLASLPFMETTRAELVRLRKELHALDIPPPPSVAEPDLVLRGDLDSRAHVRLYLLGLLYAQLGDYDAALQAAAALIRLGGPEHTRDLARDLAHAVRAEVLRMRGRPAEALRALEQARMQFDANRLNGPPFFSQVRERFLRAELLAAAGRLDEALGWYGSFDEHGPWGRTVLGQAALRQARIHDAVGRTAEAARHYARFVYLWQNADARFAPAVEQASQRLASLQRVQ
jgi:serine/threonine-protein kinase